MNEKSISEILEMLDFINAHHGFTDYNDYSDLHDAVSLLPCNNWISVEDALPEEGKKVIVANKRGKIFDIDKAHWDGRRFARSQKPYYLHVTHWMPLPKPPEV